MENGIHVLRDVFATSTFVIPPYQRAYAWETHQWNTFLSDLGEYSTDPIHSYFLGTLLLRSLGKTGEYTRYAIVDGQQRLTTLCLFVSAVLRAIPGNLEETTFRQAEHTFLQCALSGQRRFHTVGEDEPLIEKLLVRPDSIGSVQAFDTLSQRRLWEAWHFFRDRFATDQSAANHMFTVLRQARVLIYCVDNDADATQIFELQNDRGKKLTDLESVKSFLMHRIFLDSSVAQDDLTIIQQHFTNIFRLLEKLEGMPNAPSEDQVLTHHCIAYLPWNHDTWREPPRLIRDHAVAITDKKERVEWIKDFAEGLAHSFRATFDILNGRDHFSPIANLSVLNRFGEFWPLLIKSFRMDSSPSKDNFLCVSEAAEKFLFRATIAGKRADTGRSLLESSARDFDGNFIELTERLVAIGSDWAIPSLFQDGLDSPHFYQWAPAAYLLWRYENASRREKGQQWSEISWREMVEPMSSAQEYSVDHISPQDNPNLNNQLTRWNQKDSSEVQRTFEELYLHRLGNLVLDSRSAGARKGKKPFDERNYEHSTLYSQQELPKTFARCDLSGKIIWEQEEIKKRHQALVNWALKTWG